MRYILVLTTLALSGCATYQPASQKILQDYDGFVQRLDAAVESGALDPTQAMILEQQIKYQAMYAYQYQKQIEQQEQQAFFASLNQFAQQIDQQQQAMQPVYVPLPSSRNSMRCQTFDGGTSYNCS